jgi:hypothetical protein
MIMESRTINIHVNVPRSYRIDLLEHQLTTYAEQLIAQAKSAKKGKRHYRHEALCGIFSSGATEDDLLEDYLKEKYEL